MLIKASPINKTHMEGTKLWVLLQLPDQSISTRFLGETNNEHGFYTPTPQPVENHYLIVEDTEGSGTVHLINGKGQWTTIKGNSFSFDMKTMTLATKNNGDGEHLVSKLNLISREVEEKTCKNGDATGPWRGFEIYYYPTDQDWLK